MNWENVDSSNESLPNVISPTTIHLISVCLLHQFPYYVSLPNDCLSNEQFGYYVSSHMVRKGETRQVGFVRGIYGPQVRKGETCIGYNPVLNGRTDTVGKMTCPAGLRRGKHALGVGWVRLG